jgi:hypothetical protein
MTETLNHNVKRHVGPPPLGPIGKFANAPSEIERRLERIALEKKKAAVEAYVAKIRELAASNESLDDDDAVAVGELATDAGIDTGRIEAHIAALREITGYEIGLAKARARDIEPLREAAADACAAARKELLDIARKMFDDPSVGEVTLAENIVRAAATLPRRHDVDVRAIVTAVREAAASVENATFAPESFRQAIANVRRRCPELFGD